MFLQVRVPEVNGPALRFLWREPGTLEPPNDYQIGLVQSSPMICEYALRQAAEVIKTFMSCPHLFKTYIRSF